jgi:hypothetical protein
MINCFLLSILKILELISKYEYLTTLFSTLYYCFLILLPFFILIFVLNYLGEKNSKNFYPLIYLNFLAILLMVTNSYHFLYFSKTEILQVQTDFSTLITERGIMGLLFLYYNYIMILFSCLLIVIKLIDKKYLFKKQLFIILVGIIFPFASNIIL